MFQPHEKSLRLIEMTTDMTRLCNGCQKLTHLPTVIQHAENTSENWRVFDQSNGLWGIEEDTRPGNLAQWNTLAIFSPIIIHLSDWLFIAGCGKILRWGPLLRNLDGVCCSYWLETVRSLSSWWKHTAPRILTLLLLISISISIRKQNATSFISTLISQLCNHLAELRQELTELYKACNSGRQIAALHTLKVALFVTGSVGYSVS